MLEARSLTLSVGSRVLLQDISLVAAPGTLTVIIGPNGAGKSSLLSLLSGYSRPNCGEVWLNQQPLSRLSPHKLAGMRAVIEQSPGWQAGFSAQELVQMGGYRAARPLGTSWRQAMALTRCEHLAQQKLETLSGGERQRVQLARALLQLMNSKEKQRYLLLDEPTSALDFGQADKVMAELKQLAQAHNLGIISVLHDVNLALRHADQALLIEGGRAAAFGPAAQVMQKEQLEAIYGVRMIELFSPDAQLRAFIPQTSSAPAQAMHLSENDAGQADRTHDHD